jgi:hypothetical protein
MKLDLNDTQNILHYSKFELVNETEINAYPDSIVVISSNTEHKHEQIRVLPFNEFNTDKEVLSFSAKLQYFKKEIRNNRGNVVNVTPENLAVVTQNLYSFFTGTDGLEDEYADFLLGFDTRPFAAQENNLQAFFGKYYIDLSAEVISDLNEGLAQ